MKKDSVAILKKVEKRYDSSDKKAKSKRAQTTRVSRDGNKIKFEDDEKGANLKTATKDKNKAKRHSFVSNKKTNSTIADEEKKDDDKKSDKKKNVSPFHKKSKSVVYPKILKNTFPDQLKTITPHIKPKFCGRELGERVDLSKKVDPEKERLKAEAARAKYLASLKSEENLPADLQKRTKILLKGLYVEDLVYIKKFRIPTFLRIDLDILTQQ